MTRPTKVQWLLDDLCSRLGLCLRPDERARLEQNPPEDIDAFADAVLAAEDRDPHDKGNRALRGQVRELIVKHLKPKEGQNAV
jgi:hypothetical protein